MAERNTGENIWGLSGCNTPEGNLCTGCCQIMGVYQEYRDERGKITKFNKLENKRCQYENDGCSIRGTANHPNMCAMFHCSRLIQELEAQVKVGLNQRRLLAMVNVAEDRGQVSARTADGARNYIIDLRDVSSSWS